MYDIEEIPDSDRLYCRVHQNNIREGELVPGAFNEKGDGEQKGLSVDWEKYSNPEDTKARAKIPEQNGVIQFITGEVRSSNLIVVHAPLDENRSHSNIKGIDDVKRRLVTTDIFKWVILPNVHLNRNTKNFLSII